MKRISIITIHVGKNFGSVLQSIATVFVLKKLGYESIVINYIPPRCTWNRFFKQSFKSFISFLKMFIRFPVILLNNHIYTSYLSKYVHLSNPIFAEDDFYSKCPKADYYVTGSDQVWNSKHNEGIDKHYFFDGFPKESIKVSFASSIGRKSVEKDEYNYMKKIFESYKAISVREESAKTLIESMGYSVECLLDPTFMLCKNDWKEMMSKRLIKDPYILIYAPYNIHDKKIIYDSARVIAQEKNLKVVTFSWFLQTEPLADKTFRFANPGDFLSLMYYADYVITNSFHGTAFSVNLEKQFFVYYPTGFSTRIENTLKLFNLESRLLKSEEIICKEKILLSIDYTDISQILKKEKQKTYAFLQNNLV